MVLLAIIGWHLWQRDYLWRNPLADARITRLTDFEGDETDAAISPDGKFVVFLSDRDGPIDAWVTQVGSGSFVNLTTGRFPALLDEYARSVGFSSDGSEVWVRGGGTVSGKPVPAGTWMIPTIGGVPHRLMDGINAAWSRDGMQIAFFQAVSGHDEIMIASRDGTNSRTVFASNLGEHTHYPVWSHDGRFVYFARGGPRMAESDIWRVPAEGRSAEQITHHRSQVRYPAFIDDRTLLYTARAEDGSGNWLYATDVERRVPHRLNLGVEQYRSVAASSRGSDGHVRLAAAVANPSGHIWTVPIRAGLSVENDARQVPSPP
jgi:Tol biopolymer transport system component